MAKIVNEDSYGKKRRSKISGNVPKPDIKLYNYLLIIKTVYYQCKNQQTDQCNKTNRPEIDSYIL